MGRAGCNTRCSCPAPAGRQGVANAQEVTNHFKAAAPAGAAAFAIVAAIAGASLMTRDPADVTEVAVTADAPLDAAPAAAPEPGPGQALPGVAFDQVPGGGPLAMDIEIVVKFKDDAKVKGIIEAFWRDQDSGRARFEAFKAGRPEFAGLKLDRVTYSNELVLTHAGDAPAGRRLAVMRELAARLKSVSDISYAEPNMTAQPGGQ
jgi:hypothetical protein